MRSSMVSMLFFLLTLLIPKPKGKKKKIKSSELQMLLRKQIDGQIWLADQTYLLPSIESMKEFLAKDKTNAYIYQKERFDCDEFANLLMAHVDLWCGNLAFGFIWGTYKGGGHAVNLMVADDEKIYYVEPQTDVIKLLSKEDWKEVWLVVM